MVNAKTFTDRFDHIGDVGAAFIGDEVLRRAIALAGCKEYRQGDPARLRSAHRTGQHGARIALENDHAPPPHPLDFKIHHAAVNEPVLVGYRRFEGVRLGLFLAPFFGDVWDVRIDAFIERHHATHRALVNLGHAEQTPNAKAARIGMAFLQVIDLQHDWQPYLALRRFWRVAAVR